ncbi:MULTISPECIES: C40 family peptidase [Bacillus]|uniref:C40 family peptidase n=1 Tax=Bacillus TaxID=1386 RepID=UPI0002D7A352|nr:MULTISPECIES: C40 family peptidase [Bacillus]
MRQKRWLVNVPVATVWTMPDRIRLIDEEAISATCNIDKWISHLNQTHLLDLCKENRIQTQVLYGDEVIIIDETNNWVSVIVPSQSTSKHKEGYPGWIPLSQLVEANEHNVACDKRAVMINDNANLIFENGEKRQVSFATVLPIISEKEHDVLIATPTSRGWISKTDIKIFSSTSKIKPTSGDSVLLDAEKFLKLPYFWGGTSSFGYDCSGFTYSMCRANGFDIPRDAVDQAKSGSEVSLDQLKRGDLLFFAYEKGKGKIHHVGFYYGEGRMIHAPKTGKCIEVIQLLGSEYEYELCIARRYTYQ